MKENYIKLEIDKDHRYEQLQTKIDDIKESRESLSELYEGQIEILKQKLNQKTSPKESELNYQLS